MIENQALLLYITVVAETASHTDLREVFAQGRFPTLSPAEIASSAGMISGLHLRKINPAEPLFLKFPDDKINLLVTGMPRFGKTTGVEEVKLETSAYGLPMDFVAETPPHDRDIFGFDDAFRYNLGYANVGLARLQEKYYSKEKHISIFERGFIDHFVYAQARLAMLPQENLQYKKVLKSFKTYFGYFMHMLDGIVVCNSTDQTAIARGSETDPRLLLELSYGYKRLAHDLTRIRKWGSQHAVPIISLDYEKMDMPVDALKRSIYTLIKWNLEGEISAV